MVFIRVYDAISDFLENEGIIDDIIVNFEDVFGKNYIGKQTDIGLIADLYNEYALFNFIHKNKLLIDYLSKHLEGSLDKKDKEQFELLKKTERKDYSYMNKVKRNDKDLKGNYLYDHYFKNIETDEIQIVVSSSKLENNPHELNMRLIRNPKYPDERYNVIGLMQPIEQAKAISMLNMLKIAKDNFEFASERKNTLFEKSRLLSFDKIASFKDKESRFIKQDRIIMRLNKQFYERFNMDLDQFSKNVFELSNNKDLFKEMCEYYLSISTELEKTAYDTNYRLGINFISYDKVLKMFLAFIIDDAELLEEGINELKAEVKQEFSTEQKNEIALTRDQIMTNKINSIRKMIDELKFSKEKSEQEKCMRYVSHLKDIETLKPDNIKLFLTKSVQFLKQEENMTNNYDDKDQFEFMISFLDDLKNNSDNIPYSSDVMKEQETDKYNPETFYEYMFDVSIEMETLIKFLYSAYLFFKKEYGIAYNLFNELTLKKTDCYKEMFFIGKILSWFDDKNYKTYFKQAKKIDKARYKEDLEEFLVLKNKFKSNE